MLAIFMFLVGGFIFCFNSKHLLIILLSLELMVLGLFFMLYMLLMNFMSEMYFLMMFMVFSVCEGVLGLSLLISMIRLYGNDYFMNFNIL
uniref:NADH-ubiquinone oxidoreductase chain 4L n=1 Tax=Agapetus fuscipes TaxID=1271715 RepID=A0A7D6ZUP9_9NEOP|nr:NADH dehydrogenase subunit 4L [Agapetus fuscipes]